MDLCSNSTSIKAISENFFEPLETMKMIRLNNLDVIRFGRETAKFFKPSNDEVIESSQDVPEMFGNKSNFYVPETEAQTDSYKDSQDHFMSELIEIPQTQRESTGLNSSGNSLSPDALLDIISEYDERSNDEVPMFSQNVFASVNMNNQNYDQSESKINATEELSKLDSNTHDINHREGSATPDIREGSLTPDLEFNPIKPEPLSQRQWLQSNIATQVNPEVHINRPVKSERSPERKFQIPTRQADIDTQAFEDFVNENEVKFCPTMMQPTQPLFIKGSTTRLQIKRQAEIKPKVVSLQDFDDSESLTPSPKKMKQCLMMETQPYFPQGTQVPKMPKSSPTLLNRILMSSDDESDEEQERCAPLKFIEDTKEFSETQEALLNSPIRVTDSPLIFDSNTPEIIPKLPSDSQLGLILDMINSSQQSNDDSAFNDNEKTVNEQKKYQKNYRNLDLIVPRKRIRRRIMKYGSFGDDDEPSTSKACIATPVQNSTSNATATEQKSYAIASTNISSAMKNNLQEVCVKLGGKIVDKINDADFLMTSEKIKLTSKFLASICRRIPIVSTDFIKASVNAGKWLDPSKNIMIDKDFEAKKKVSLKKIITMKKEKLFNNVSVIATKNTVIPMVELIEIIQFAGGECIKSTQKPKHKKLVLVHNAEDSKEVTKISKKYPKIIKIQDLQFSSTILLHKLP